MIPTTSRRRDAATFAGSLLTLLIVLIGVPVALALLAGWPLPHTLPSMTEVRRALDNGWSPDGLFVLKVVALVAWLAWAEIALCLIVELGAALRGRHAPRLPAASWAQPLVTRLVAGLLLAQSLTAAATQTYGRPSLAAVSVPGGAAAPVLRVLTTPTVPAPVIAPATAPTPATVRYHVTRHDTLWDIAERHLGDPLRWREIFELNVGRVQSDGRRLANPDRIYPGWVLDMPADAVGLEGVPQRSESSPTLPPVDAPVAPTSVPPLAQTSPSTTLVTVPPSSVAIARPDPPATPTLRPDHHRHEVPVGVIVGSLAAGGFVAALDGLRRIQLRRRQAGHAPRVPGGETAATETRLRCAADSSPADRLDLALRALAGCLSSEVRSSPPQINVVSVGPDAVEIILSGSTDAHPGPFDVSADGRAWTLPVSAFQEEVARLAAGQASPAPALATVGTIDDRQVLIDLEASPRVLVTGDHSAAKRLIWAVAMEMTTSPWADDLDVVMVTDRDSELDNLERATVTADVNEVINRASRLGAAAERDLRDMGIGSTLACRLRNPADPWTPTVVLVPEPLPSDDLERLFALAQPGRGVGVVAVGTEDGLPVDRELVIDERGVTLSPPNLRLTPVGLSDEMLSDVEALLGSALSDEPGDDLAAVAPAEEPSVENAYRSAIAPEAGGVLVAMLGTIDIRGGEKPVDRRRSAELIVYLALHPEGVEESRLRAVLWPEEDPSREAFNQTVSRARQPLGQAADGSHHLPRLNDDEREVYRLGTMVTSDAALLESAYVKARHSPSDPTIEHLASLLGLMRGIPFEGTKGGWQWTAVEGHASRLASLAADAAHIVAQWALARGDVQQALWATSQGLRSAPGDEVLYRDRMEAHDRAGNMAGVEAVMSELRRTVDAAEPYDSIHPETVAYYEQLTQRSRETG